MLKCLRLSQKLKDDLDLDKTDSSASHTATGISADTISSMEAELAKYKEKTKELEYKVEEVNNFTSLAAEIVIYIVFNKKYI